MGANTIHCEPVEPAEPNGNHTLELWVSAGELTDLLRALQSRSSHLVVAVRDETGRRLAGTFSSGGGAPVLGASDRP